MDRCSCVPDCNNWKIPGVLSERYFLVGAGLRIIIAKVGLCYDSEFTTKMWIGGDEFGIGVSYHVFSPDKVEHESSSGPCVKNG
eukprot:1146638-Pelagomonas_calceolata.AAC.3